jgi:hypothetical protein
MAAAISNPSASVRVVGANGQISLGKQFTGRQVLAEEQAERVWLVSTATVVPDNERWLHVTAAAADLVNALDWAARNVPNDATLDQTLTRLARGKRQARGCSSTGPEQRGFFVEPVGTTKPTTTAPVGIRSRASSNLVR